MLVCVGGEKSLCTFNDPMSFPNRMMCPISNPLLLVVSTKLMARGAVDSKVLQNVKHIIGTNFTGVQYDGLNVFIR